MTTGDHFPAPSPIHPVTVVAYQTLTAAETRYVEQVKVFAALG